MADDRSARLLASYGATFSHAAWIDWIILGSFTVILLGATRAVLGARCGTRLARRGLS
jgi:hypothetical protein